MWRVDNLRSRGTDVLTGGTGADIFEFAVNSSISSAIEITDFSLTDGDKIRIDLSALDVNETDRAKVIDLTTLTNAHPGINSGFEFGGAYSFLVDNAFGGGFAHIKLDDVTSDIATFLNANFGTIFDIV